MAGLEWFELDVDFHGDPKIRALASRLRQPLADAYVARLYAYCYKHAVDRFDPSAASDTIEDVVGWKGRRGHLFDALMAVEVLERDVGRVVVHGVAARLAPHLAHRQAASERQRKRRDKAAKSIGLDALVTRDVTPPVTRDVPPPEARESQPDRDRDSNRDQKQQQQRRHAGLPFESELHMDEYPGAFALRQRLAEEWPGIGWTKDPAAAEDAVARCGLDACAAACLDYGRTSKVAPSALGFFTRLLADLRPRPVLVDAPGAFSAASGPAWWTRLAPDALERFRRERSALDPSLGEDAPPTVPGALCPDDIRALIARYETEARQ